MNGIEDKVPYTDPSTGETRMVSKWAAAMLAQEQPLDAPMRRQLAHVGRERTEREKAAISKAQSGKVSPMRGKEFSEEVRKNMTAAHRAKPLSPQNVSGHKGVTWNKGRGKWAASISVKNKTIGLGLHATLEEAIAVRKAAEVEHGYTTE